MVWTPCHFDFDDIMEGRERNENQSKTEGNRVTHLVLTLEAKVCYIVKEVINKMKNESSIFSCLVLNHLMSQQ